MLTGVAPEFTVYDSFEAFFLEQRSDAVLSRISSEHFLPGSFSYHAHLAGRQVSVSPALPSVDRVRAKSRYAPPLPHPLLPRRWLPTSDITLPLPHTLLSAALQLAKARPGNNGTYMYHIRYDLSRTLKPRSWAGVLEERYREAAAAKRSVCNAKAPPPR